VYISAENKKEETYVSILVENNRTKNLKPEKYFFISKW
jgi:hypothetical protein